MLSCRYIIEYMQPSLLTLVLINNHSMGVDRISKSSGLRDRCELEAVRSRLRRTPKKFRHLPVLGNLQPLVCTGYAHAAISGPRSRIGSGKSGRGHRGSGSPRRSLFLAKRKSPRKTCSSSWKYSGYIYRARGCLTSIFSCLYR